MTGKPRGRSGGRHKISPHLKKEQSKARISAWVLAWLDEHRTDGSRGELLEAALVKLHRLKVPVEDERLRKVK